MSITRYIQPAERELLRRALPDPRDRLLVILGLNTGLRISELLTLHWRQLVRNGEPIALLEVSRRFLKGGRVQRVTGHRTASIVTKHYFQPGREDFRRTLAGKMPALLVGGEPKIVPLGLTGVREKLERLGSTNWRGIRDGLLARFLPDLEKIIPAEVVQIEVLAPVA